MAAHRSMFAYISSRGLPAILCTGRPPGDIMLTEYLFRDTRRLNEYASQINPALTVVEKSKEWTVGLSLAGPKAEGKQSERVRPMTDHEKAQLTLSYLRDCSAVHEGRPVPTNQWDAYLSAEQLEKTPFVLERCTATKIAIPSSLTEGGESLVLWVSYTLIEEQRCDALWLLEDVAAPDKPVWTGGTATSGYTLLQAFVHYARAKLLSSSLAAKLEMPESRDDIGSDTSLDSAPPDWSDPEWFHFFDDPVRRTKELGCLVSAPRKIETLYRIREVGDATAGYAQGPRPGYSLFGYPMWIAAA
jgi:hypothetical protein